MGCTASFGMLCVAETAVLCFNSTDSAASATLPVQLPLAPSPVPAVLCHTTVKMLQQLLLRCRLQGIKCRAMDLVLFVRHGSFYNLFDVDADVGLRVGLNLSGAPAANMWKVGCHINQFAVWAAKVRLQSGTWGMKVLSQYACSRLLQCCTVLYSVL